MRVLSDVLLRCESVSSGRVMQQEVAVVQRAIWLFLHVSIRPFICWFPVCLHYSLHIALIAVSAVCRDCMWRPEKCSESLQQRHFTLFPS